MADDLANGHTDLMAPSDYTDFMIGGSAVRVPNLKFIDLEKIEATWFSLNAEEGWIKNARKYLRMVAMLTGRDEAELAGLLTSEEALSLALQFNELLTKSGILRPEAPAATESPGTGTSTLSSQTSQSEESAPGTPSE